MLNNVFMQTICEDVLSNCIMLHLAAFDLLFLQVLCHINIFPLWKLKSSLKIQVYKQTHKVMIDLEHIMTWSVVQSDSNWTEKRFPVIWKYLFVGRSVHTFIEVWLHAMSCVKCWGYKYLRQTLATGQVRLHWD